MNVEMRLLSSQEKVFPDQAPSPLCVPMTCLQGELYSFQLALYPDIVQNSRYFSIEVSTEAACPLPIESYQVDYVPVRLPYFTDDGRYLRKDPGLFPDPLIEGPSAKLYLGRWNSLFFIVDASKAAPGQYPITITIKSQEDAREGSLCLTYQTSLTVKKASLPVSDFRYTCWFHTDCLADYYHVEPFSEEHWQIMAAQVKMAARFGQNMFLTPIFTPPLDTAVGTERTTVQLIGVTFDEASGKYTFDLSKLDRYIDMIHENGGRYFEISHLFSQWSSHKCPIVVAKVLHKDGSQEDDVRIFGWHTAANSKEYIDFLTQLLPMLVKHFDQKGLRSYVYFHLTDEPSEDYLKGYLELKNIVAPLIDGYPIMDAMSSYQYFTEGVSDRPVVATTALDPFLAGKRPDDFWVYYCCGQGSRNLSNRFLDMPGWRTRVLGVQCYSENVKGFLQWGLNFYNTALSLKHIDPYKTADGYGSWPAGDPFIIYPGKDGLPVPSQRLVIFNEALQDLHALELLESLTSRDHVLSLINEGLTTPVGFFEYPQGEAYLLTLRQKVDQEIDRLTK